jgi:glycogen phosphorylase
VGEYTEQRYLPAAVAYRLRSIANECAIGRQIVDWQHSLEQTLSKLNFGEVKVETRDKQHVFEVEVEIYLSNLDPKAVRASTGYVYSTAVSAVRRPADYTVRVIPHCDGVAVPLENPLILWQR